MLKSLFKYISILHAAISTREQEVFNEVAIFLYGGFGDSVMKLHSLSSLSSAYDLRVFATKKQYGFAKTIISKNSNVIIHKIELSSILSIRRQVKKSKLLLLSHSPRYEFYLLSILFGISSIFGFIGDRSRLRSIGCHFPASDVGRNDYQNYLKMASYFLASNANIALKDSTYPVPDGDYVVININKSQGWPAGRWDEEGFVKLIKYILERYDYYILLVGNGDEEISAVSRCADVISSARVINLAGKTNFS